MHEVAAWCGFHRAAVGRANGGSRQRIVQAPASMPPRVLGVLGRFGKSEFRSRPSARAGGFLPWQTATSGRLLVPLAQGDLASHNSLQYRALVQNHAHPTEWTVSVLRGLLQIGRPSPRAMCSPEPAVRNSLKPKALNRNYTFRIGAHGRTGDYRL